MRARALVLCDDQWHPAETVRGGLGALRDSPVEFEFRARGWSPVLMKTYPLVVIAKANHTCASDPNPWLAPDTEGAFREFVDGGGGLLLLHAGTCYKDFPVMRSVTGGTFLSHPAPCAVALEPVAGCALTAGVDGFVEPDEPYQMVLDDPAAHVFLRGRSVHGMQPAGWTRSEGAGRVCVLTPGHHAAVWRHPQFQKLLVNGLNWLLKFS